jgi:hypothetical protein
MLESAGSPIRVLPWRVITQPLSQNAIELCGARPSLEGAGARTRESPEAIDRVRSAFDDLSAAAGAVLAPDLRNTVVTVCWFRTSATDVSRHRSLVPLARSLSDSAAGPPHASHHAWWPEDSPRAATRIEQLPHLTVTITRWYRVSGISPLSVTSRIT